MHVSVILDCQYDCSGLLEDTPILARTTVVREEGLAKTSEVRCTGEMLRDEVLPPDHHELVMICVCDISRCGTDGKNPDDDVAPVLVDLLKANN
jgi:hypothetical protein